MLTGILRFEWRYQVRRWTFVAVAAFFAFIGFGLAATAFGPDDIHLNSPYSIAESVGLASLLAVLAATFFCAQGALRDSEHRMAEIVYSTAITRRQYVFGRYAGVVAAVATAFGFVFPGLFVGTYAVAHDAGRIGPLSLASYLWAALLLAFPNLLLICALLFAIALLTRSALATYVGGVLAYVLYFVAALFSGSPIMASASPPSARGMAIAAIADPFGLSGFFEATRYWTAAERNVQLLGLGGHVLLNRLLWLAATAAILWLVYRRFAFRLAEGPRGRRVAIEPEPAAPSSFLPVPPRTGARAAWSAFLSASRGEIRHAVRSWPLATLLVGWVAMSGIELSETFRHAEFGTLLLPTTGQILGDQRVPLSLFGLLLLVYYAAELVWRERSSGMVEIVEATPAPNGAFLAAKVLALGALIALLTATAIASAMAFQLLSGWTHLQPALYASLFLFLGLPLLLVAVLTVMVQTLVPNRYLGILVSALAVVFWHLGALGGPNHPLLRFAAAPPVPYSDLSGFGPDRLSFAWFSAYWGAFVVLLLALACGLWRRGTDTRLSGRLARLRRGWSPPARWLAAVATLLWIGLGALVFQQTNRWNAYRTAEEVEGWRAGYEGAYRRIEALPQPTPVGLQVEIDLHPEERRYGLRGRYLLENRTSEPVQDVWVTVRRDLARVDLHLAGQPAAATDPTYRTYRFALSPPLAPGGRTPLDFDLEVVRRGATAGGADNDIVGNGSILLSTFALPSVGYRQSYEIRDPDARRRQRLPPSTRPATLGEAEAAGSEGGTAVPMSVDATLTTSADQIAVAPGALVASGERQGRRFFRYQTEGVLSPLLAFASARYAVARRAHAGIALEVYHDPQHGRNVEAMLDAAARALDYCTAQFGPYPHRELRIVEVPSTWTGGSGFASPGTLFLVEDNGFLTDRSDPERIDVVTKRVAHEVAHQWWGHQVSPAAQPGASTLVETLARYTEMRVLAGMHGESAVPPVLSVELDRYLRGRTGGDEASLEAVQDQSYVYYSKGGLVMNAIRDLIGEPATNAALRRLVDEARAGRQPDARRLLSLLESEAPEAARPLIADWFEGMILYDLRIAQASARPLAGGRVLLDLKLAARRSEAGEEHEVRLPIDEELELALYGDDPGVAGRGGPPLETRRVRVRGDQTISFETDAKARYVLLDPNLLRIERNRADNLRAIARAGG